MHKILVKYRYKLIKYILVLKSLLFGFLFRNSNVVAVISAHDSYSGNCKYAVMALQEAYPEKQIYWLTRTVEQGVKLQEYIPGLKTGIRLSIYYMWILSRAKYILTDGDMQGGFLANGAIQIDFCHGIAIKKAGYDNARKEPSVLKKILYFLNRNRFMLTSSSAYSLKFLADMHRLPLKMRKALGTPCVAPLIHTDVLNKEISLSPKLQTLQQQNENFDKVFLYAPTYRDNGADFLNDLCFDVERLQTVCKNKNVRFLIKLHPFCSIELPKEYSHITMLDKGYDGTLSLALCDVLITDYSSMYFNAIAGDKGIICMHGDIESYRQDSRGVYEESLQDMQGIFVDNFNDLCDTIENYTHIPPVDKKIKDKYWDDALLLYPNEFLKGIR